MRTKKPVVHTKVKPKEQKAKAATAAKVLPPELRAAPKPKPQFTGLHNLTCPEGAHHRKKILGRGSSSGHGKTSTRGSKGQTSRAGRDFYAGFEGGQTPMIRRMPKRGFTSKFRKTYQIVNLDDLKRLKDTSITLEILQQHGLIKDKTKLVKILGDGEIQNAVTIQAHAVSGKAAEKIKSAGGHIEIIDAERAA